jgi:cytidylate kinase
MRTTENKLTKRAKLINTLWKGAAAMKKKICIAIDGPAGAGKSTVAKIVAQKLKYRYIDTGAMYRAVALAALRQEAKDESDFIRTALESDITIRVDQEGKQEVFLNGENVSADIRKPEVNQIVSKIAAIPRVRERMVELQRLMAKEGGVVMDGRDIGTHVLPNAQLKIFLTASLEKRAHRRFLELREKGYEVCESEIIQEISQRDRIDSERDFAPLRKSQDAILIDTSGLSAEEVAAKVLELVGRL